MKIICNGIGDLPEAARKFVEAMGERRHFSFDGVMGAGKTTFISAVCRELGCADDVASPTFSIVNEYADGAGRPVYHFDFYRIEDPQEALDIGVDDYFYSGFPCFMEWAGNIGVLLPEDTVPVRITENEDGARVIEFE